MNIEPGNFLLQSTASISGSPSPTEPLNFLQVNNSNVTACYFLPSLSLSAKGGSSPVKGSLFPHPFPSMSSFLFYFLLSCPSACPFPSFRFKSVPLNHSLMWPFRTFSCAFTCIFIDIEKYICDMCICIL